MPKMADATEPGTDLRIVVFVIPLSESLPVAHLSTFSFDLGEPLSGLEGVPIRPVEGVSHAPGMSSGNQFVSLRFWQHRVTEIADPLKGAFEVVSAILPSTPDDGHPEKRTGSVPLGQDLYQTTIEAVTILNLANGLEQELTRCFDRCEDSIDEFVRAARMSAKAQIPVMSRQRFPFAVPVLMRTIFEPIEWDSLRLFHLHTNFPFPSAPPMLTQVGMQQLGTWLSLMRKRHPFTIYAERQRQASDALLVDGDRAGTLVNAQMAVEVLIDHLLGMLCWEEGKSPRESASQEFAGSLAERIKTAFHTRLGGNWGGGKRGAYGIWNSKIRRPRNLVVHAGNCPTREEAADAVAAIAELDELVRARLTVRRATYPRTALMLLGRPGLERRGAWNGRLVRFVNEEAGREPDWIESYSTWRSGLEQAMGWRL